MEACEIAPKVVLIDGWGRGKFYTFNVFYLDECI